MVGFRLFESEQFICNLTIFHQELRLQEIGPKLRPVHVYYSLGVRTGTWFIWNTIF